MIFVSFEHVVKAVFGVAESVAVIEADINVFSADFFDVFHLGTAFVSSFIEFYKISAEFDFFICDRALLTF